MISFETLRILIFLVPGFLASIILDALIVRKEKNKFVIIIEALIFSVFIYALLAFCGLDNPITFDEKSQKILYHWLPLILMFIFSVISSIFFGWLIFSDRFMRLMRSNNQRKLKLMRKWKITEKSTHTPWFDSFRTNKGYITITFSDNNRINGYPLYFSDDPEQQYIYLQDPAWISKDKKTGEQKYLKLGGEGILITPGQKIETIEFFKP